LKPAPFEYHAPETVADAAQLLAELGDGAKVLAGGQSLVPMLNFRLARPSALVDLSELGLDGIRLEDGALVVGAMTRQWDLEHHADGLERCRKAMLLSKVAIWAGGAGVLAYVLGPIWFDPTILVGALAAIIGGVVVHGSNSSTSKQIMGAMKAAEAQRAELIGMIDLPPPGAPNGRQAVDS
jgi:hypothetical protein